MTKHRTTEILRGKKTRATEGSVAHERNLSVPAPQLDVRYENLAYRSPKRKMFTAKHAPSEGGRNTSALASHYHYRLVDDFGRMSAMFAAAPSVRLIAGNRGDTFRYSISGIPIAIRSAPSEEMAKWTTLKSAPGA